VEQAKALPGWRFDNSYAGLPASLFSRVDPTPVRAPKLVILNAQLAHTLGLNADALRSKEGVDELAGNRLPEGALPIAQAYAGHQYGYFTMLGDGRAILLGEQITPQAGRVDIQLKGPGMTPYSRRGDGRAALGPMLREYIISEAMHALGIPTTRSLAVVATGQPVMREEELQGAILTRVAVSHIRVGTFQYAAKWGAAGDLKALADYTIRRHYPAAAGDNQYLSLLQEVIKRQAALIAKWQLVGFIHGVMNTDNMAISGETIDYGPCAFMDTYDPTTVFSSIDSNGRYAYGNQPNIAAWNLARFAESLLPLLSDDEDKAVALAEEAIASFAVTFRDNWLTGMRAKLGISDAEQEDESLIESLLSMMQTYRADYTHTFRALTDGQLEDESLFESAQFAQWHALWQARLSRQQESTVSSEQLMRSSNPAVIPRNYRVEEALKAAEDDGNFKVMEQLLDVLASPYMRSHKLEEFCTPAPQSAVPYRTYCGT
jgi:uncharacterized protein YdiU (UPF0061 family)